MLFTTNLRGAVTVPDNGFGTANMPIRADYLTTEATPFIIISGLPPGTTVQIPSRLTSPTSSSEVAGGGLGGTQATGNGMSLAMSLSGTGSLAGYTRSLLIPLTIIEDAAPRTAGAPVQSFATDTSQWQGQITADVDFDLLRITAGSAFGLPSPGNTTLTQNGSAWNVDSFFDITYRIDFVGHAGGPFSGESGSTTATARISVVPEPSVLLWLFAAPLTQTRRRRR
jgi:hypothetical protein